MTTDLPFLVANVGADPSELRELVKHAKAQREQIDQLTAELDALNTRIKLADRAKKRRSTKRKSPK